MSAWPTRRHHIGPSRVDRSYLNVEAVLDAARAAGADAIHPGYGLLSENAAFAEAVTSAGFVWIGPAPETIAAMGDKGRARAIAAEAGVPVLPGSPRFSEAEPADDRRPRRGDRLPAARQGGRRRRRHRHAPRRPAPRISPAWSRRRSGMAARAFGDGTVYLERYVPDGAAHRGPGLRLRRRPRRPSLRARMLGPAPLPEGDRGRAVAGARRRHPRRDDRGRGGACREPELRRRRHGRVHLRRRHRRASTSSR